MVGKKIILIVSLLVLFSSNNVIAVGTSNVVSDPLSYNYYVSQIKLYSKQLAEAKQAVKEAQEIKKSAMETVESMKGVYYHAVGTVNWIKDKKEMLDNRPNDAFKAITGIDPEEESKNISEMFSDNYSDVKYNNVDWLIEIGNIDMAQYSKKVRAKIKELLGQQEIAKQIDIADDAIEKTEKGFTKIATLAKKIDNTPNLKASQDLTITLLAEIGFILRDMLEIMAVVGKTQAIATFHGKDPEELKRLIETQNKIEENMKLGILPEATTGFEAWPEVHKIVEERREPVFQTIKF